MRFMPGSITVASVIFIITTSVIGMVPFKTLTMRITLASITASAVMLALTTSTLGLIPLVYNAWSSRHYSSYFSYVGSGNFYDRVGSVKEVLQCVSRLALWRLSWIF